MAIVRNLGIVSQSETISKNIVYRNIERVTSLIENTSTSFTFKEIPVPFPEGIVKRITIFKIDDSDPALSGEVVISESNSIDKQYKIAHYKNIDFQDDYLDSLEDIYYNTSNSNIYIHLKVDQGSTTDFYIKLDLEKTN